MVAVATKVADNPVSQSFKYYTSHVTTPPLQVAIVADRLNLPGAAKTRPPLSIPGKLIFPRLVALFGRLADSGYSCFMLKYELFKLHVYECFIRVF